MKELITLDKEGFLKELWVKDEIDGRGFIEELLDKYTQATVAEPEPLPDKVEPACTIVRKPSDDIWGGYPPILLQKACRDCELCLKGKECQKGDCPCPRLKDKPVEIDSEKAKSEEINEEVTKVEEIEKFTELEEKVQADPMLTKKINELVDQVNKLSRIAKANAKGVISKEVEDLDK